MKTQASSKRQQIIEGARRLFFSLGYDLTSMDDVAREAGVSKATLYAHFVNKEMLFGEVARVEPARIPGSLFALDKDDHDVPGVLGQVGRGLVHLTTSPAVVSLFRALLAVGERMPELGAEYYNQGVRGGMLLLADYLAHHAELGLIDVPDPELAAAQFLEMAQTTMVRPVLFGASTTPSEERINLVVDAAVRVFMAAYGKPP